MHLHLYRPVTWWQGMVTCRLDYSSAMSAYDAALLVRSRRATLIDESSFHFHFGVSMSDDTTSVLRLVTPPAAEPLTLTQAKAFLRIDQTADDDAITRAIVVARQFAEQYLRAVLLPQTWDYIVANPPVCTLPLPLGPAQSIASVTLTDTLGNATTVNPPNYRLSVDGFAVIFANVPTAENVTVRYSASSYATADDVPAPILQGMLHHITALMESRDGAAPLPMQSVNCYAPYRRVVL